MDPASTAPILPAVPPKIIAGAPVSGRVPPQVVRAAPLRTAFDAAPASTLAARAGAEKARTALQAAVRAVATAKAEAEAVMSLGSEAHVILAHEGLPPDMLRKFTKAAAPLLDAFVLAAPAETPAPAPAA